jgi:hypothetical protein
MNESSRKPDQPNPFQYSLRSLLVVTTVLALLLGLAKWNPTIAPYLLLALVTVPAVYIVARWRYGPSQIAIAIGMFICVLMIILPWFTFPLDSMPAGGWFCYLVSVGVIGLSVWIGALLIVFAGRNDRLDRRPWRSTRRRDADENEEGE